MKDYLTITNDTDSTINIFRKRTEGGKDFYNHQFFRHGVLRLNESISKKEIDCLVDFVGDCKDVKIEYGKENANK